MVVSCVGHRSARFSRFWTTHDDDDDDGIPLPPCSAPGLAFSRQQNWVKTGERGCFGGSSFVPIHDQTHTHTSTETTPHALLFWRRTSTGKAGGWAGTKGERRVCQRTKKKEEAPLRLCASQPGEETCSSRYTSGRASDQGGPRTRRSRRTCRIEKRGVTDQRGLGSIDITFGSPPPSSWGPNSSKPFSVDRQEGKAA